jgi:hypothetical protein
MKDVCHKPSVKQKVMRGPTVSVCDPHREIFDRFQSMLMARVASNMIILRESMAQSIMSRHNERFRLADDRRQPFPT